MPYKPRKMVRRLICLLIGHTLVNDRPFGERCIMCEPRKGFRDF